MSEQIEKLKAVVRELESELNRLEDVDEHASGVLQDALAEIQTVLRSKRPDDVGSEPDNDQESSDESGDHADSLPERLSLAAHQFEDSHPTLTGILSRLIDGLGQMGI